MRANVGVNNNATLPDGTGIEVFAAADGGLGGYSAVVDPADPTKPLKPEAAGGLPLSTGAATSALQAAANASLASLDGKTPALVGGAQPVAVADGSLTTLGAKADAEWDEVAAAPSHQGVLKRATTRLAAILSKLGAGFPAALSAGGNLKVSLAESTASQAVTGSVSVSALPNTTLAGQTANTADFDTGAGVVTAPMVGIALPAAGGPVPGGTATNPVRVDPTGTTTQPVSVAGTVATSVADGQNVTIGAKADAVYPDATGAVAGSAIALLKAIFVRLAGVLTFDLTKIGGTAVGVNAGVVGNGTQRVVLATDQPVLSTAFPSTAKGTQGATGLAVQELKDSGRSSINLTIDSYAVAAVAETLINTLKSTVDLAAPTSGLSFYTVTTGKRLRIQIAIANLHTITGNTTAVMVIIRIRAAISGSVTTSSPIVAVASLPGTAAVNQAGAGITLNIPDGFELPAGATIGVTVECPGFVTTTAAPKLDATIIANEY